MNDFNEQLLEENRYFEIVDSFQTIGIQCLKGTPESIVSHLINHFDRATHSGINVIAIEIDEELFRKQVINNCFKAVSKFPPTIVGD